MKLFYAPGSSSLLVHIVLYEAGLPFTAIRVDEHTKIIDGGGDYRSVNPLGYVPAQLKDGTLLTQGVAIVQYIADQVPHKRLVPPNGTIERTKLQSWLNFVSSEMHKGAFSPLGMSSGRTRTDRFFIERSYVRSRKKSGRSGGPQIFEVLAFHVFGRAAVRNSLVLHPPSCRARNRVRRPDHQDCDGKSRCYGPDRASRLE